MYDEAGRHQEHPKRENRKHKQRPLLVHRCCNPAILPLLGPDHTHSSSRMTAGRQTREHTLIHTTHARSSLARKQVLTPTTALHGREKVASLLVRSQRARLAAVASERLISASVPRVQLNKRVVTFFIPDEMRALHGSHELYRASYLVANPV